MDLRMSPEHSTGRARHLVAAAISPLVAPLAVFFIEVSSFLAGTPLSHVDRLSSAFHNAVLGAAYALPLAYVVTFIFGLPIAYALSKRSQRSSMPLAFVGALIGFLVFLALGPLLLTADDACGKSVTCGLASLWSPTSLPWFIRFVSSGTCVAALFSAIAQPRAQRGTVNKALQRTGCAGR